MAGEQVLIGLTGVVVLGAAAHWLAWRLHLPSIILLLGFGFLVGPGLGLLDPDAILGDLLVPFVGLSVALILFEGGLSLRLSDLRGQGAVVAYLVSLGALVTWVLGALAAHYIAGISWDISLLLGAVFVVTGPTVIGPLLRHVRPSGRVGAVVKWEGILNDPVGAILAVLVFDAIVAGAVAGPVADATTVIAWGVVRSLLLGSFVGLSGALILMLVMGRGWLPGHLQVPVTLALVVAVFTAADLLQPESGLLAVTLMGVALANQARVEIKHIITFKEHLSLMLIAVLFILLAARLRPEHVDALGWRSLAFLGALMFLVRPATIVVSTWGSALPWRERTFLAWMAPRGIVAAAVSSFFALRLEAAGHPEAGQIVPVTFLVIVGTVIVYGLTARPVARALGLARGDPQGALVVGADDVARTIARGIRDAGYRVVLLDTNKGHVHAAEIEGLDAVNANVLAEDVVEGLDLTDVGRLLALTPNDEVNALSALHFTDVFGEDNVYQLPPSTSNQRKGETVGGHLRGRLLFAPEAKHDELWARVAAGDAVHQVDTWEDMRLGDLPTVSGERAIPLFLVDAEGHLVPFTDDGRHVLRPGERLLYLGAAADG